MKPSRMRTFGRFVLRFTAWSALLGLVSMLGLVLGLGYAVHDATSQMPDYETIRNTPTGTTLRYFSSDGQLLHTEGPQYGEWIGYEQIPSSMRKAIVAIEDRRYRQHKGVDPIALARAVKFAWDNRGTGRRLQGASTITQQVARTLFLDRRYDLRRKVDEVVVALALEQALDKNQILELYLNRIYLGGGSYGIDAASRRFFGHPATQLTTEEAALLAGMAKAPSDYSPTADREASMGRMKVVLGKMVETGQDRTALIDVEEPDVTTSEEPARTGTRHFIDWITPQVQQLVPDAHGNIDVHTTLNVTMQVQAQEAVRSATPRGSQGALVSMEDDGAIRAMVGGLDYVSSNYNRATQAQRQPGSAFKIFVYLAALEAGYRPNSAVLDAPITLSGWSPRNASGRYSGVMPLDAAFAWSVNSVAARLAQDVGVNRVAEMSYRLGISSQMKNTPSLSLGSSEVRLIDMVRAYASVSAGGQSVVPYGVNRIEINGRTAYQIAPIHRQKLISPRVAADMISLMRGTIDYGTGRAASIGRPAAGKTGTTTSNKDGWFVGFSSGLATGVWMGRDDAQPVSGLQGGTAPARAFASFMARAVKDRPAGLMSSSRVPEEDMQTTATDELTSETAEGNGIVSTTPASPNAVEDFQQRDSSVTQSSQASPPVTVSSEGSPGTGRSRAIRPDL